jgi:hypothetical protein
MSTGDDAHRRVHWGVGEISFAGDKYPILAGNTNLAAPVGIGTYLAEDTRYVIFWEKGGNERLFQTVIETAYTHDSTKRVIVAELSTADGLDWGAEEKVQIDFKEIAGTQQKLNSSSLNDTITLKTRGGSATNPAYSFGADSNTGMYSGTADQVHFSTNGVERLEISNSGITVTGSVAATDYGNITSTGWFRGVDGSLAAPEYSFTSDTDTGMYRASADHLSLSAGGQSITVSEAVVTSGSVHYMGIYPTNTADGTSANGTTGRPYVNIGTYPTTASGWNYQPFNAVAAYYHVMMTDGTVANPSLYWSGSVADTNTGFYWKASGNVGYTDDGTHRVDLGGHPRDTVYNSGGTPTTDTANYEFGVSGSAVISSYLYVGHLRPETDNVSDIGTSTRRFDDVYATSGTVNTSDARAKEKISPSTLGLDFVNDLNPVSYEWKAKKENKMNQTHYGIIAQEVVETLQKHGIKSMEEFGGIVHDGGEETLYGARYQQFIPILMKAVQELSAEIKELKEKN